LRLRSGSVWPAIALHATHNAVVQWVLDAMTDGHGKAAWFAGEFGISLALSTMLVAFLVIRRRKPEPDAAEGQLCR